MAKEIQATSATAGTLYAQLFNSVGKVWNGSSFEDYVTANIGNYDIAMTEQGTASGIYLGDMPSSAVAGTYRTIVRIRAGGSPAETDVVVTTNMTPCIEWNGTVVTTAGILADDVAHGGPVGSSTATIAATIVHIQSESGSSALTITNNSTGRALDITSTAHNGILVSSGDGYSALNLIGSGSGAGLQIIGGSSGNGIDITSGGSMHDINLAGNGDIYDNVYDRPLSIRLADNTDHGGTFGSSSATLSLNRINVTATTGIAVMLKSLAASGSPDPTGNSTDGHALFVMGAPATNTGPGYQAGYGAIFLGGSADDSVTNGSAGFGVSIVGGSGDTVKYPNTGLIISVGDDEGSGYLPYSQAMTIDGTLGIVGTSNTPAVRLVGPYDTPGPVILIDATTAISGINGGPGILIQTGDADGISITSAGSGKADINLTGTTNIKVSESLTGTSGYLTKIVSMVLWLYNRFAGKNDKSATQLKSYDPNSLSTTISTQAITSSGDDETQGKAT